VRAESKARWRVRTALESFQSLREALPGLTQDDVIACLELEAATRRRPSVIDRLIARAARLNEIHYVAALKEKFHHGTSQEEPQRR